MKKIHFSLSLLIFPVLVVLLSADTCSGNYDIVPECKTKNQGAVKYYNDTDSDAVFYVNSGFAVTVPKHGQSSSFDWGVHQNPDTITIKVNGVLRGTQRLDVAQCKETVIHYY